MTLNEYFHLIVNKPPVKELTMFDVLKAKWTEFWTTQYIFKDPPRIPSKAFLEFKAEMDKASEALKADHKEILKPKTLDTVQEQDPKNFADGFWGFEMYTPEWVNEYGETVEPIHTVFVTPHEGTWLEVLDRILDAMGKHYGYNIKEQVYYSVPFPLNDTDDRTGEPFPGYGRCLNDERLQQVLLAFPELYLSAGWSSNPEVGMFK